MQHIFRPSAMMGFVIAIMLLLAACGSVVTVTTGAAASPTATTVPLSIVTAQQSQHGVDATAAQISATATCPTGTTLFSGGYSLGLANNTQLVEITADYPSASNAWTATEANPQSGGAITLTTYAYCLKSATITTQAVTALSGSDGTATATCPAGQTLTGGGFKQAGQIAASFPTANTWHTAFIQGVVGPSPYTAYAVCANAGLAAGTISNGASGAVANNATGTASATCAAGQLLTGGGYNNANGAYALTTDLTVTGSAFATKVLNVYASGASGPGGPPPTPTPLQVTAYGICVTSA